MVDSLPAPSPVAVRGLRPCTTGELVDHLFLLYRRHFIPLFYFSAMVQLPPFALEMIRTFFTPSATSSGLALGYIGSFLGWLALTTLGSSAMTDYVANLYLGQPTSIRHALAAMTRRSPAIFVSSVMQYLFVGVALLPCLIPFALGASWWGELTLGGLGFLMVFAVVCLAPGLVLLVRYLLVLPAVMLEKRAGWSALRRSSELIRFDPHLGFFYWGETRISIVLLVVGVVHLFVAMVSHVPVLVSGVEELLRGNINPEMITLSPLMAMATHLLTFLGSSLLAPLYVIAATLFYYDIRVRKEAYDLELLAASLPPAPSTPAQT